MASNANPIAQRVRALREEKGWSQERLAEVSGLSRDAVSRIERGDRKTPRMATVMAVAEALEVKPSMLLDSEPLSRSPNSPDEDRIRQIRKQLASVDDLTADAIVEAISMLCTRLSGRKRGAVVRRPVAPKAVR